MTAVKVEDGTVERLDDLIQSFTSVGWTVERRPDGSVFLTKPLSPAEAARRDAIPSRHLTLTRVQKWVAAALDILHSLV